MFFKKIPKYVLMPFDIFLKFISKKHNTGFFFGMFNLRGVGLQ